MLLGKLFTSENFFAKTLAIPTINSSINRRMHIRFISITIVLYYLFQYIFHHQEISNYFRSFWSCLKL